MRRLWLLAVLVLPSSLSAQTATLMLSSPQAGQAIAPGSIVEWSIEVSVSGGDNEGLALVLVDLLQDAANPERVDLTPALVPVAMTNFSRPEGVSNPGPGGVGSGYGGTPSGAVGERDLLQIGGAQNTFGVSGSGMGTVVDVTAAVGQSGPVLVAQGSFVAPTAAGDYSYHLVEGVVNVLSVLGTAPGHSTAVSASVSSSPGTFSIEVSSAPQFVRGDCNVDASTNIADSIHLLSHLFTGPLVLSCDDACDTNDDGTLDLADAVTLLTALFDGGGPLADPSDTCGADPTSDTLGCVDFSECP